MLMSYDELNKLSHDDLHIFEERLTAFFRLNIADSYIQLRKHLESRIPRTRFLDSDALIDDSITRLTRKVVEFARRGEPIDDLKRFASKIALFIILEDGRRRAKHVEIEPDPAADPELSRPRQLRYSPETEIRAIEREMELDCMKKCLKTLSQEKQILLRNYYPAEPMTSQERKVIRQKLAVSHAESTAEPSDRKLNNLQVQISKTRSKLSDCFRECLDAHLSRNPKLAFLKAQQIGI